MQVDALAIRMRPRSGWEAADLGVRLCQSAAGPVFRCFVPVALAVIALCLASYELAEWLPVLALWWLKPWIDRTILFVLSRAAFGQQTTLRDLWEAQRQVWWRHLLLSLTLRRLSPWRSFTQPVYQLEGLSVWQARKRLAQIRRRQSGTALLLTSAFALAESAIAFGLFSLIFWFAPSGMEPDLREMFTEEAGAFINLSLAIGYSLALLFLEPFYVAAGFGMYLNRRAELEAWDIEQELRRAFAQ